MYREEILTMFSKLIQKSFLKNVLISILLACTILVIPACFERYNIHEVHNLEMLKEAGYWWDKAGKLHYPKANNDKRVIDIDPERYKKFQ